MNSFVPLPERELIDGQKDVFSAFGPTFESDNSSSSDEEQSQPESR